MARFLHHSSSCTFRKWADWILAFSWLSGLGAGALVFRFADDISVSLMRSAAESPVSIVGLLICTLLPFLFTAFAVYLSLPRLLIPISFCKAFAYAYVSCAVLTAFGTAGWLVRALLLFSDTCCAGLLYGCWMRCLSGTYVVSPAGIVLYGAFASIAALLDFGFFAPLLRLAVFQ